MTPRGVGVADELLADRYRLLERIAVGGMGEVWRAQDTLLDRVVAVKTLKPEFVGDEDFRARFRAEARHAGRLTHSGIASVYDFGESPASAWLVMELVDGEPLSTLLRREGALSVERTLDLVTQVADALHAAHLGGVVHRDVKPGNLLVRPDGVLKVTDFGIASATDAVPLTQTGLVVGTAYYLSPEQASGGHGSPSSDLYSLGVVAYECLTGVRPFAGDSPVAVAIAHLREPPPPLPGSIPAPVRALVERALEKDPAARFPDAAAMADEADRLREAAAGDDGGLAALPVAPPVAARAEGAQEPLPDDALAPTGLLQRADRPVPGSRARSSRRAVTSAAALLAVLAVGLGVRAAVDPAPLPAAAPAAPAAVTVPEIAIGTPEDRAAATVTAAGLSPSRRDGTSRTVPVGGVLAVEPAPGTSVEPGASVVLVVSTGPATVRVDAAAYLGKPAAEVRAALAGLGLVPRLAYDGQGRPVGTVSAVEPAGDLVVGSVVLLRVVPVPPPAAVPPPPPPPATTAPAVVAPAPAERPGKGKGKGRK